MSREWKPGDVVVITNGEMSGVIGFGVDRAIVYINDGQPVTAAYGPSEARPLVVIDPEDREQVERLRDLYDSAYHEQNRAIQTAPKGTRGNALQAALREFANPKPPKPDEPTGIGAVALDDTGCKWIQVDRRNGVAGWAHCDAQSGIFRFWSDIDAIEVLSEGVHP